MIRFHESGHIAELQGGQMIRLSPSEYTLARRLSRPGVAISRRAIVPMDELQSALYDGAETPNNVRVLVCLKAGALTRKFAPYGIEVRNVFGLGYGYVI